ncbi:MAG: 2Fe-2S iron-sulfur cluster-binding protein [Cycloclasticus sp.]
MPKLTLNNQTYLCHAGATVLDTLLTNKVDIAYGCKQGDCQSCLIRSLNQTPPIDAQKGLKETQQAQNYFLACQCKPTEDMELALVTEEARFIESTVVSLKPLNPETIELVLEYKDELTFKPGQFINLKRDDGLVRSYSIANLPSAEKRLEFHIRKLPNGGFSEWAHDHLNSGDVVSLQEPAGDCFYISGKPDQPLLLVGTGTGLAPLAGIVRDALKQGHTGPIHLFHGSRDIAGLYWVDEMKALAENHANVSYHPCLSGSDTPLEYTAGRVHVEALKAHPKLQGWRVFLCGHPDMVKDTQKKAYLAGASLKEIYADAFTVLTKKSE